MGYSFIFCFLFFHSSLNIFWKVQELFQHLICFCRIFSGCCRLCSLLFDKCQFWCASFWELCWRLLHGLQLCDKFFSHPFSITWKHQNVNSIQKTSQLTVCLHLNVLSWLAGSWVQVFVYSQLLPIEVLLCINNLKQLVFIHKTWNW